MSLRGDASLGDAMKQRALRVRPTEGIEEHFLKALGHYLRIQILWILNERVASASELSKALGVPLNRVSNHLKALREAGCVEVVKQIVVRNTVQRFYRASARIFLDETEWPKLPPTIQEGMRITLLQNLMDDAVEAVARGEYDSCEDSHMSWTPMIVDEQGRQSLTRVLGRALKEVMAVQEEAGQRLRSADAEGVSYSVSILGYPSIGGMRKVEPAQGAEELTVGEVTESTEDRKKVAAKSSKTKASSKKAGAMGKGRTTNAASKPQRKSAPKKGARK